MREEAEGIARRLPRYVRVNTLITTLAEQKKKLRESGHNMIQERTKFRAGRIKRRKPEKKLDPRGYAIDPDIPDLLVFRPKGHSDLMSIASVKSGELIIQQVAVAHHRQPPTVSLSESVVL